MTERTDEENLLSAMGDVMMRVLATIGAAVCDGVGVTTGWLADLRSDAAAQGTDEQR